MKLLRYGPSGQERPGLLDAGGVIRDLSARVDDIAGEVLSDEWLDRLRAIDPASLPAVDASARLGSCVGAIGNYIAVGLNYADHAAEAGLDVPPEPILFSKATSAICGPNDPLIIPRGSQKTDWEVELGVVIGRRTSHIGEDTALDHVAGYCTLNDVSERAFQIERKGQWIKGKSAETFGPVGPWLVTRDEIANPQKLRLWTKLDGATMQDGTTANMVYDVAFLISYISQFMVLMPGDVIATGTPPGVGMGREPQLFLRPGQTVRCGVEGLGEQTQTTIAWHEQARRAGE